MALWSELKLWHSKYTVDEMSAPLYPSALSTIQGYMQEESCSYVKSFIDVSPIAAFYQRINMVLVLGHLGKSFLSNFGSRCELILAISEVRKLKMQR